jgi:putative flippase GtrA
MTPLPDFIDRIVMAWHRRAIGMKAVSFAVVGLVNSGVDLAVFSLAYFYLDLHLVLANLVAWTVAVTGSYIMNALTTFARESGRELSWRAYAHFALSQAAGLVANTAAVLAASFFVPVLAGKLLAIGASFAVNFSLSHFVIFREQRRAEWETEHNLAWAFSALIALAILGTVAATMGFHGGTPPTATDLSSRSRSMP